MLPGELTNVVKVPCVWGMFIAGSSLAPERQQRPEMPRCLGYLLVLKVKDPRRWPNTYPNTPDGVEGRMMRIKIVITEICFHSLPRCTFKKDGESESKETSVHPAQATSLSRGRAAKGAPGWCLASQRCYWMLLVQSWKSLRTGSRLKMAETSKRIIKC